MSKIEYAKNSLAKTDDRYLPLMNEGAAREAVNFHRGFPEYSVTPLVSLKDCADEMGLGGLYIKDESYRFGLNAFKVLGGSFAIAKYVAEKLNLDMSKINHDFLVSKEFTNNFQPCTFFTATDGNHGRGVAWAANRLNQRAVVLMPKGSVVSRFENIKSLGASVTIEQLNYDDCVRKAALLSEQIPGSVVIQDTAWEGYEKIPTWIMQGYTTLISEAIEQLNESGVKKPTHVFVQAGVGSLAGAVAGYLANRFPEDTPKIVVMECRAADCFYCSALANDGKAVNIGGDLDSIMAGLCCGEANTIAWDILKNHATAFLSCEDSVAATGIRRLAFPVWHDTKVISGESGAIGMGVVDALCRNDDFALIRNELGINKSSQILLISTEGDTDPERYRSIVWDGAYPNI